MPFTADVNVSLSGALPVQQSLIGGLGGVVAPPRPVRIGTDTATKRREFESTGALLSFDLIRDSVEECLRECVRETTGDLFALMAKDEIAQLLRKILGRPSDNAAGDRSSVGRSLRDVADAFSAMAENSGRPETAVQAMTAFTQILQSLSDRIADLAIVADGKVAELAGLANDALRDITRLNGEIAAAVASGGMAGNAQRARDDVLDRLAQTMDFTSLPRGDGTVSIFTRKGKLLIDGNVVALSPSVQESRPRNTDPACLGEELTTGALKAMIEARDRMLPGVVAQLDTLAQTLQSRLNQVSNRALAGTEARHSYTGSRRFADPGDEIMSLSGGDTVISLLAHDGRTIGRVSLLALMKRFRRRHGLPDTGIWPVGQIAPALDGWLGEQLGTKDKRYVSFGADGNLVVALPTDRNLAFRDQRGTVLRSSLTADANRPLGLKGPLAFSDQAGNRMALLNHEIAAGDSLDTIARRLSGISGLTTSLAPLELGSALVVASTVESDLVPDPDPPGATVGAGLGLTPSPDLAGDDVAINHSTQPLGALFTSSLIDDDQRPLGLSGILAITNEQNHDLLSLAVDKGWNLAILAARLDLLGQAKGVSVATQSVGTRFQLKIAVTNGGRIGLDTPADAQQSTPLPGFAAAGGELVIAKGTSGLGKLKIAAGAPLDDIAASINAAEAPFAAAGIRARVRSAGPVHSLEIGGAFGEPLGLSGSAVGPAPGQLAFCVNPRDCLGLAHLADYTVPGFANFFGLNDVFVADPDGSFEPKLPPGLFNTNAQPGTARALAVNPRIRDNPAELGDQETLAKMSDLLHNPVNIPAAGDLPRISASLVDYAESIVVSADRVASGAKSDLAFQQVLLTQIENQQTRLPEMQVNDRLDHLSTFQQTHHDSARVLATMPQLLDCLGPHTH
jgi:hypothetical protein